MKLTINHNLGGGEISRAIIDKFSPGAIVQTGEFRPELARPITIGRVGYDIPCSPDLWGWDVWKARNAGRKAGAQALADVAASNPHITHLESPNEPHWSSSWSQRVMAMAIACYSSFHAGFADEVTSGGKVPALGAWSVASVPYSLLTEWAFQLSHNLQAVWVLTCHAYSHEPRAFSAPIRAIAYGLRKGLRNPTGRIISTESGRERIGGVGGGWRTQVTEGAYALELGKLGRVANAMPELSAWAVFLSGSTEQGSRWYDYALTRAIVEDMPLDLGPLQPSTRRPFQTSELLTLPAPMRPIALYRWPGISDDWATVTITPTWQIQAFDQTSDGAYIAVMPDRSLWMRSADLWR